MIGLPLEERLKALLLEWESTEILLRRMLFRYTERLKGQHLIRYMNCKEILVVILKMCMVS